MKRLVFSSCVWRAVALPAALLAAVPGATAPPPTEAVCTAAARAAGLEPLRAIEVPAGGDVLDRVGVCRDDKGRIVLCPCSADGKTVTALPTRGRVLQELTARELVPALPGHEVIVEVRDDNPDEEIRRLLIFARGPSGLREVFQTAHIQQKGDGGKAEEDDDLQRYGDDVAWSFVDIEGDGDVEVLVRQETQTQTVQNRNGATRIVTGAREKVHTFLGDARTGAFRARDGTRFVDFLPARPLVDVRASSAVVPDAAREQLEAEALARAVYAATEGKDAPVPEIDTKPFARLGADRDLATAWREASDEDGTWEWIEVDLGEALPIRMVRIVADCIQNAKENKLHNRVLRYEVRFDDESRVSVVRAKPNELGPPALGMLRAPVRDKSFASQDLIFFRGDQKSRTVRITLEGVERRGKANMACISEISVH